MAASFPLYPIVASIMVQPTECRMWNAHVSPDQREDTEYAFNRADV